MASKGTTKVCRLCRAVVEQKRVLHLFTPYSSQKRWAPRLAELLGISVEQHEKISPYVCRKCSARAESLEKSLTDLTAFKAMARSSLEIVLGSPEERGEEMEVERDSSGVAGRVVEIRGSTGGRQLIPRQVQGPLKRTKETSGSVGVSPDTVRDRPHSKTARRRLEYSCKYIIIKNNKITLSHLVLSYSPITRVSY